MRALRLPRVRRLLWVLALFFFVSAAARAQTVDKTVTVYGAKIQYKEAGAGPAVILLHGLGGDSSNWISTIGPLSEKHRVLVPDQIGFGRSDKPMISYSVGTYVDFLAALYNEWKVERASLVGNSLGGWIAAAFAIAHPEKVDRLVLVDAAGFSIGEEVDRRVLRALNGATREAIKDLLPLVFYDRQRFMSDAFLDLMFTRRVTAGDGYTIQQVIDSIVRGEDVLDKRLSGVKQPTLIIWGREDGLTPLEMGERFNKGIAGSKLLIIEKCGHVPQLEKPEEFNAALLKFLGDK